VLFSLLAIESPAWANSELVVEGAFPGVVDGNTQAATFTVALPNSVILQSNTMVNWSTSNFSFTNEAGDAYLFQDSIWSTSPFVVNIQPLGRRASVSITSIISVKVSVTLVAKVDSTSYFLTRTIDFQNATAANVSRVPLPSLPSNFGIDIDNPDPGLDAQTTIRARFRWSGNWNHVASAFDWVGRNGDTVKSLSSPSETESSWVNFNVTSDQYLKTGFTLRAGWSIQVSYNINLIFIRDIPIDIHFPPAVVSPENTKIFLSCSFSNAIKNFQCMVLYSSTVTKNNPVSITLQTRADSKPWTSVKVLQLSDGLSASANVSSLPGKTQDIRAILSRGGVQISSNNSGWTTATGGNSSSVFNEAKLRSGLKANCTLLPTRFSYLKFKSSGYTLNNYGQILYIYSLGATNFSVLKDSAGWNISAPDSSSRATLNSWECSFPFKVK
jgi:hypothetical protein